LQGLRVQGDTGVQQDLLGPQENQDQLDQKDLWEKLVTQVHQESKEILEQEDQEELGELQASLEVWVPKVYLEWKESLDPQDHLGLLVLLETPSLFLQL